MNAKTRCIPLAAWAIKQARVRDLSPGAGWLLTVLADAAATNPNQEAWPSQDTLAEWTRLKPRRLRDLTKELVGAGLLAVTRRGKGFLYRLLRDASEGQKHRQILPVSRRRTAANIAGVNSQTAANIAGVVHRTAAKSAGIDPPNTGKIRHEHRQNPTKTPANIAAKPTKEPTKEPLRARGAQQASKKVAREKEGDASASHDPFNDVLAEIAAGRRTSLAAVGVERVSAPVEECIASENVVALVRGDVRRALSSNYPPRKAERGRWEQHDEVAAPKPALRSVCLTGEALRLARERAGIWPRAQEAAVAD
jgi:hypothetical protein